MNAGSRYLSCPSVSRTDENSEMFWKVKRFSLKIGRSNDFADPGTLRTRSVSSQARASDGKHVGRRRRGGFPCDDRDRRVGVAKGPIKPWAWRGWRESSATVWWRHPVVGSLPVGRETPRPLFQICEKIPFLSVCTLIHGTLVRIVSWTRGKPAGVCAPERTNQRSQE